MKKNLSPTNVFVALLVFSTISLIYFGSATSFGNYKIGGWTIFSIIIMFLGIIAHLVFLIILIKNKKPISDEFTTKILYKSGYYAFITIVFFIAITFLILGFLMIINNEAVSLSEFVDIRLILGILVIIQILGSLIFTVLYTIFNKIGDLST